MTYKSPQQYWLEYSKTLIFASSYHRQREHTAFMSGFECGVLDTLDTYRLRSETPTDKV